MVLLRQEGDGRGVGVREKGSCRHGVLEQVPREDVDRVVVGGGRRMDPGQVHV